MRKVKLKPRKYRGQCRYGNKEDCSRYTVCGGVQGWKGTCAYRYDCDDYVKLWNRRAKKGRGK